MLRGPPEVGLEDLPDVHSARHAERVEHDVHRTAVGQERHVLLGHDAGNDTLVAVAAGHLVADRDLALLGQVDLHQLDDARRQLVRLQNAVDALFRLLLDACAFSSLAASMIVADSARSMLLVLDAERLEVERRELEVARAVPRVSLVPAGIASSTVPALERERDRLPFEQLAAARRRALR